MDGQGFESRQEQNKYLFYKTSRPATEYTQSLINGYRRSFSGVKRPGGDVDHSHVIPRLRDECRCTDYPLMCLEGFDKDNCTFLLYNKEVGVEITSNINPLCNWLNKTGHIDLFRDVGELKDIRLSTCWKEQDLDVR
jgi:hypothetical protein